MDNLPGFFEQFRATYEATRDANGDVADSAQPNHYAALGVTPESTENEIKKAYRNIARSTHPDKHSGQEGSFVAASAAYEVLSSPRRRHQYDVSIMGVQGDGASGSRGDAAMVTLTIPIGDVYRTTRRTVRYDCRSTSGVGRARVEEIVIPRGTADFDRLRFSGLGDEIQTGVHGDLIVVVRHRTGRAYQVENSDIRTHVTVTLRQALCGEPFAVRRPDGTLIAASAPHGTVLTPGSWWKLSGHGLPEGKTGACGDLLIHCQVTMPSALDEQAIEMMRRALPQGPPCDAGIEVTALPVTGPMPDKESGCPIQ